MAKPKKRKSRARKRPSAPLPFTGDHGTGTAAAMAGTYIEEIKNDDGSNPNRRARRRRKDRIDEYGLSMRQFQAAKAVRDAWCTVEMQSSGEAIKEGVDSSAKPDATVDRLVDAQSRLVYIMSAVPSNMRDVVEHVCWHNMKISELRNGLTANGNSAQFKVALDLVANRLRY